MPYVEDPEGLDRATFKKGPGSVHDRVLRLAHEHFGVGNRPEADHTPDLPLDEVATDSPDDVVLLMELEEEFDVTIPDAEFRRFRTLGDVIHYLEGR